MEILKRAKLFWREVHRTSRGPLTEACESINTSGLARCAVFSPAFALLCACLPPQSVSDGGRKGGRKVWFGLVRGSSPGQFGYFRVILPPHTARTLVLVPAEAVVRGLFNLPTDSQPLFSPRGISRPNCGSRPTPGPASYLRAPSSEVKVFNLFLYAQYLLYVCNLFIYMHMHVCQII